jgi:hypothetical protein
MGWGGANLFFKPSKINLFLHLGAAGAGASKSILYLCANSVK